MNVKSWLRDAIVIESGARLLGMLDDAKITRHYRDIGRHPSLQHFGKRVRSPLAAYTRAIHQGTPLAVWSIPALAVTGMVLATDYYPQVAGPQYQSSISGQPGIGSAGSDLIYGGQQVENYNIFQYLFRSF